ncbi:MAG: S41 family peptidase [Rikenellaceae bacterium]
MKGLLIKIVVVTIVATTIFSFAPTYAQKNRTSTKQEIRKFKEFIKILDKNYIESLDYNYLTKVAIQTILDQTDPYSTYLDREMKDEIDNIIDSPAIDTAYMINKSTSCIKVRLFSHDAANDILQTYREQNSPQNLILDLRGNKGGLVTEAIKSANLFLKKNTPIFKRNRRGKNTTTHTTQYDGELLSTNLVIIIDRESASASEIVAGAMQSNKRATIVGERSFGKGLIISPFTLPDGSVIFISTSQYTTPIGGVIQRSYRGRESTNTDGGINPDIIYDCGETVDNEDFINFSHPQKKI